MKATVVCWKCKKGFDATKRIPKEIRYLRTTRKTDKGTKTDFAPFCPKCYEEKKK
jgi:thymidine kinase